MTRLIPSVGDIRRRLGYATQPPRPAPSPTTTPPPPSGAPPPIPPTPQPEREAVVQDRPRGLAGTLVRHPLVSVTALLTAVLAAFSGLWTGGALLIDGPGIALYVRLATDYLTAIGRVPYWVPEMWSGAPVWALAPSLPAMMLVPVASIFGPAVAVKVAILAFQVIGGVGAYVLARSIWGRTPANLVAALVYTLHPFVISHGPLAGAETASGVLAAVPWLVWTLRLGPAGRGHPLRGGGRLPGRLRRHPPGRAGLRPGDPVRGPGGGRGGTAAGARVDGAAAQAVRPGRRR